MCSKHPSPASTANAGQRSKARKITRRRLLWAGGILAGGVAATAAGGVGAYYGTRYPAGAGHSGWLAIRGATALTGENLEAVTDAIVLVQDGQIIDVGSRLEIPDGAEILDAPGATVLPGLIEMHAHMLFPQIEPGEQFGGGDWIGHIWDITRHMPGVRQDFLEHGVTAVRDLGGDLEWAGELRTLIDDGTLEGPRTFFAGPLVTTPGGHPLTTVSSMSGGLPEGVARTPRTPQEAEQVVAELCDGELPVDVIKVVHDSGAADLRLDPHEPEVLAALAQAAHERGVPVTAHCGSPAELGEAVDAGFDGIEHLTLRDPSFDFDEMDQSAAMSWPEGLLDEMAAGGVALDPTLLVELYYPQDRSPEQEELAQRRFERLREAHEAGVQIVAGSDAGMAIPGFGDGLIGEVMMLGEAGLPNRDVLQAATSRAAAALRSDQIGVLEAGRAADLLLVDGDPLADLQHLNEVMAVLRDGCVVVGDIGTA